jgi:charged multivesicular body protein 6
VYRAAKLILRRKKYQEGMLAKTETQLDNLEEMVSSIEFASLERQVVDGLEQGNEALKALKQELDIDRVERVMEDAAELQAWTDVR